MAIIPGDVDFFPIARASANIAEANYKRTASSLPWNFTTNERVRPITCVIDSMTMSAPMPE